MGCKGCDDLLAAYKHSVGHYTKFLGAPQRRRSPVGEGPTQGGCWLNLVAGERPSWVTGKGGASRQSPRKVGEQLCRP
jgi:hypothetical protein